MAHINVFLKGFAAMAVVIFSYINQTFSPLFWVLAALIAIDLIINVKHPEKQFEKLGSAAVSLGIPVFIGQNVGQPGFMKYLVVLLCIVYIEVTFPQIRVMLSKLTFSKDPKVQAADAAMVDAVAGKVLAALQKPVQDAANAAKDKLPAEAIAAARGENSPDIK